MSSHLASLNWWWERKSSDFPTICQFVLLSEGEEFSLASSRLVVWGKFYHMERVLLADFLLGNYKQWEPISSHFGVMIRSFKMGTSRETPTETTTSFGWHTSSQILNRWWVPPYGNLGDILYLVRTAENLQPLFRCSCFSHSLRACLIDTHKHTPTRRGRTSHQSRETRSRKIHEFQCLPLMFFAQ